jgi:hypothetical protein|tara:strand:- start:2113 stop:2319 length:207 start_codon:yes stop_codon:yes gene_type:complete
MTVNDLKEVLEYYDGDMEVRFASQPNYPFEYSINDAVAVLTDDGDILYLEEGRQIGYLDYNAKEELGW